MKRRDLIKYLSMTPVAGAAVLGDITPAHAETGKQPKNPKEITSRNWACVPLSMLREHILP